MARVTGYSFAPVTNLAGDISAIQIVHQTLNVYDAGWYFHGVVSLYWDINGGYYFSCAGITIQIQLSDIYSINGSDPDPDAYTTYTMLSAIMPTE